MRLVIMFNSVWDIENEVQCVRTHPYRCLLHHITSLPVSGDLLECGKC